jgi:hypothetical protein
MHSRFLRHTVALVVALMLVFSSSVALCISCEVNTSRGLSCDGQINQETKGLHSDDLITITFSNSNTPDCPSCDTSGCFDIEPLSDTVVNTQKVSVPFVLALLDFGGQNRIQLINATTFKPSPSISPTPPKVYLRNSSFLC